jgi:hypothetical protein
VKGILLMWISTIALCTVVNVLLPPHTWKFFWLVGYPLTPGAAWAGLRTLLASQPGIAIPIVLLSAAGLITASWLAWRVVRRINGLLRFDHPS